MPMSALSELLKQRVATQKIGVREIARRAQDRGHSLSHGTVSKYLSGQHPEVPAEETLRAFHDVLDIPLEQLRKAAGLPAGAPGPYTPPSEADRLDLDQREAVDQIIRLLARKSVMGNAQHPAPSSRAEVSSAEEDVGDLPTFGVDPLLPREGSDGPAPGRPESGSGQS